MPEGLCPSASAVAACCATECAAALKLSAFHIHGPDRPTHHGMDMTRLRKENLPLHGKSNICGNNDVVDHASDICLAAPTATLRLAGPRQYHDEAVYIARNTHPLPGLSVAMDRLAVSVSFQKQKQFRLSFSHTKFYAPLREFWLQRCVRCRAAV